MKQSVFTTLKRSFRRLAPVLVGPPALAFVPALCLSALWFGGEGALIVLSAVLPLVYLISSGLLGFKPISSAHAAGVLRGKAFEKRALKTHKQLQKTGRHAALILLVIDEYDKLVERHGQATADSVVKYVGERLVNSVRGNDCVGQMGDARFGICTMPVVQLDLELCMQMATRLKSALEEPVTVNGTAMYVTISVGLSEHRKNPKETGQDWLDAAALALREAQKRGPSVIRVFTEKLRLTSVAHNELREEVTKALDAGHIQPWFQPQISTNTGQITGFEALARWSHPERGILMPGEFLLAIEQAGQLERLADNMIYFSFAALQAWDLAGLRVPQVGVNFAGPELHNPRLPGKIQWELDRFDLDPSRLAVEVLETVVTSDSDEGIVTQNINALAKLGCHIDLDDFGTGQASFASIRQLAVSRIKIDRSFVMRADKDPDQQRMISAILTMAERLRVETLAEGIETVGEHALLAQLGCDHVQGFGIARPMPLDKTFAWIEDHLERLEDVPLIQSKKSL